MDRSGRTPVSSQAARQLPSSAAILKSPAKQPHFRETCIREGLWLNLLEASTQTPLSLSLEKEQSMIDFGIVLSGSLHNQLQSPYLPPADLNNREGYGGLIYLPQSEIKVEIPAQRKLQILHVHVAPATLREMIGEEIHTLPDGIRAIVEEKPKAAFVRHGRMDPGCILAAKQMLQMPETGVKRLFLEAKALELISLQIGWASAAPPTPSPASLTPSERDRIFEARNRLVHCFDTPPPTLSELSRDLGISCNKLEAGFKAEYGTTVFGYYREFRMQTAFDMLQKGDHNVSEVAWHVGYTNISHFGAAYKKRFGVLPKVHLKEARHR